MIQPIGVREASLGVAAGRACTVVPGRGCSGNGNHARAVVQNFGSDARSASQVYMQRERKMGNCACETKAVTRGGG
eukprot:2948627-Pleurochrysis_carterae.AAC.1